MLRASKYAEAIEQFGKYIDKYPNANKTQDARFWRGECYYNKHEYALAILEYQKFFDDYNNDHPNAPTALIKQGLSFEQLHDNKTAHIVYKKLILTYPQSKEIITAKKRLESME